MTVVVFSRSALKALKRMPRNQSKLIRKKIDQLAADPASLAQNVAKLVGEPGERLRVGSWRVIFERHDDTLDIRNIRPRGGAYG